MLFFIRFIIHKKYIQRIKATVVVFGDENNKYIARKYVLIFKIFQMPNTCPNDKILNPRTNRCVKKDGKTGRAIHKLKHADGVDPQPICTSDKILNPKTNRCVLKTGKIGKGLQQLNDGNNKPRTKKVISPKAQVTPPIPDGTVMDMALHIIKPWQVKDFKKEQGQSYAPAFSNEYYWVQSKWQSKVNGIVYRQSIFIRWEPIYEGRQIMLKEIKYNENGNEWSLWNSGSLLYPDYHCSKMPFVAGAYIIGAVVFMQKKLAKHCHTEFKTLLNVKKIIKLVTENTQPK